MRASENIVILVEKLWNIKNLQWRFSIFVDLKQRQVQNFFKFIKQQNILHL